MKCAKVIADRSAIAFIKTITNRLNLLADNPFIIFGALKHGLPYIPVLAVQAVVRTSTRGRIRVKSN